jgi:hypothetical protein
MRIIDVVDHVNVMDDEFTYREPQRGSGDGVSVRKSLLAKAKWRYLCVAAKRWMVCKQVGIRFL